MIIKSKIIDVHGMTADESRKRLMKEIEKAPHGMEKIIVIHGCNNGTAIRDTIRNKLKSKRILEITPTFSNDGETTIYLKKF
ncbi:MAG: Smr/MutS family protein [Eubacterium sp.]|jgi:DNA-nicking Smr family endonuclease|nr:Smr/MutS family protein [Eubacterium sp.]